jgi:hypothetical protein
VNLKNRNRHPELGTRQPDGDSPKPDSARSNPDAACRKADFDRAKAEKVRISGHFLGLCHDCAMTLDKTTCAGGGFHVLQLGESAGIVISTR